MANKNPIDLVFLRGIIEDDRDFERELFLIFLENAKKSLSKMLSSLDDIDGNSWYLASHAFKGSCASIGAFPLSKSLEEAQNKANEDKKIKSAIFEKVTKEFSLVEKFLKEEVLF